MQLYGIRYHIITLIAVFLALGLGLLLGGTLGEEVIVKEQVQLLDQLENRYVEAKTDNSRLHKESTELKQRTDELEQVMKQMGHHYVQDRLVGKKVAVLHLEPADLSPLMTVLQKAGADVTSTLVVTNQAGLTDPSVVPGVNEKLGLAADADLKLRQQRLAQALVQDLYFRTEPSVLADLQDNKALTVGGTLGIKPDAVILVGGAGEQTAHRLQWFDLPLMQALQSYGVPVVGVEQSDVLRSGVRYYREQNISTVDNIDQVTGMIALIDVLAGAQGHFGIKKSAEALMPQSTTAKEVSAQ